MIKKLILLACLFAVLAIVVIFGLPTWKNAREEKLILSYLEDSQLKEDYEHAMEGEEKIKEGADNLAPYIQAGFYWKTLGETTKEELFFKKALGAYSAAMEDFGMQYYMPYSGSAGIYETLGEYENAEKNYKKAIEISPGEAPLYIRLAELYRFSMNKMPEEIQAIYNQGEQRVLDTTPLFVSKASYLKEIGRKEEALVLFEAVFEKTKSDIYKMEVDQLKSELGILDIES